MLKLSESLNQPEHMVKGHMVGRKMVHVNVCLVAHTYMYKPKNAFVISIALPDKTELEVDEQKPNHLMVLVSSDRGLCGGVHSSLAKAAKAVIAEQPSTVNTMLVPCGDKARTILQKSHGG